MALAKARTGASEDALALLHARAPRRSVESDAAGQRRDDPVDGGPPRSGAPGLRGGPGAGPHRRARAQLARRCRDRRRAYGRGAAALAGRGGRRPLGVRVRSSRWAWRRRAPAGFRRRGHVLASLRTGRRRSVTGRRSRRRGRGWRGILRPRAAGRGAAEYADHAEYRPRNPQITRNTGRGIRGTRGITGRGIRRTRGITGRGIRRTRGECFGRTEGRTSRARRNGLFRARTRLT